MNKSEQIKDPCPAQAAVPTSESVRLGRDMIDRIARLARLDPDNDERMLLQEELGRILSEFRKIEAVDTTHIEPVYHPQDLLNCLRPDQIRPSSAREQLLAPASKQKDGFFVAPRTVE